MIEENKISENCIGILTDTSEANFKFSYLQFRRILFYLKRTTELKGIKLAVIVNTPQKTIFPVIAGKKIPFIKIRPFSIKESALEWMLE